MMHDEKERQAMASDHTPMEARVVNFLEVACTPFFAKDVYPMKPAKAVPSF